MPPSNQTNNQSIDEKAELDEVLDAITSSDECLRDEYLETSYHRTVSIELSDDAAAIYGTPFIEVSCRQILTLLAEKNELPEYDLIALRDDFYSGDDDEDNCLYAGDPNTNPPSRREVAKLKLERKATKHARDIAREEIERHDQARASEHDAIWAPFAAEKEALAHRQLELVAESEQIAQDFMVDQREGNEDDSLFSAKSEELDERDQLLDDRWKCFWNAKKELSEAAFGKF